MVNLFTICEVTVPFLGHTLRFQEARAREPQLSTNFCDKGIKSRPGKSGGKQQTGGYTLPENEQLATQLAAPKE